MKRPARAAAHVLAGLALLLLAAAGLQALVEHDQRARYPAPGQLVDIGDGRLVHLRTWGADNDGPALLLSVSANMPSSTWAWSRRTWHASTGSSPSVGRAWAGAKAVAARATPGRPRKR